MKNKLDIGDLLHRSNLFVEYAGIYLGNEQVLHNSPDGMIEICTLKQYANGKPLSKVAPSSKRWYCCRLTIGSLQPFEKLMAIYDS
jgi:hypothetical protein